MDAIEFLSQQHYELRDLFEKVELASGDERRRLFESLADLIDLHTRLEERLFYPAARASRTRDLVDKSVQDHNDMTRRVKALREMDVEEDGFREKLRELRVILHSHLAQEEESLFPKARTWLGMRKLRELGEALQEEAEEIARGEALAGHASDADRPWQY